MGMFWGQQCPLCGVRMTQTDALFGTSDFACADAEVSRFADSVMHCDCYANWEHRARFARASFDALKRSSAGNRFWGIALADEQVLVKVNPDRLVSVAQVALAATGSEFRVALADWQDWLGRDWREDCHHEFERESLEAVIPVLLASFPDAAALVAASGMGSGPESGIAAEGGLVAWISHEIACRALAERSRRKGVTCPGCGRHSTEYQYVPVAQVSETGPGSHLVCRGCGKEFGPEEA